MATVNRLRSPNRVNSPRQLAARSPAMPEAGQLLAAGQGQQQQSYPHQGYGGGGWGGQWHTAAEGRERPGYMINAHATLAETADDQIKRQGGLSPSLGPSGINDLYAPDPNHEVGAFARLQNSMARAQTGDTRGADLMEKAQQQQGMGNLPDAQGLKDAANTSTAIAKGVGAVAPAAGTPAAAAPPITPPEVPGIVTPYGNMTATAQDQGGPVGDNMATVAEKEPETEFLPDGSTKQYTKPTLLKNPAPGIIVPNHKLRQFLARFAHPSTDESDVSMTDKGPVLQDIHSKAYDNGGVAGVPALLPTPALGGATSLGGPGFGVQAQPGTPTRMAQPIQPLTRAPALDEGGMMPGNSKLRGFLAKAKAYDKGAGIPDYNADLSNLLAPTEGLKIPDYNADLSSLLAPSSPPAQPASPPSAPTSAQPPQNPIVPVVPVTSGQPANVPQLAFRRPLHSWEEPGMSPAERYAAAGAAARASLGEAAALDAINQHPIDPIARYGSGESEWVGGTPESNWADAAPAHGTLPGGEKLGDWIGEQNSRAADAAKYAANDKARYAQTEMDKYQKANPAQTARLKAFISKWKKGAGIPANEHGGLVGVDDDESREMAKMKERQAGDRPRKMA